MTGMPPTVALRAAAASFAAIAVVASASLDAGPVTTAPNAPDRQEPLPKELTGVGIDEKRDAKIPLDLPFVDEQGSPVNLRDFFHEGKPVVLTLNYYRCPMLCTLVLNGYVKALKEVGWIPGQEFESVTVTIDPRETPDLARAKKDTYVDDLGRSEAAAGWHFLTGSEASIKTLAETVGFRYRYLEDSGEYAHAAAIIVLTPDGRISRYLYGVEFPAKTLRLALVEASQGKIGTALDQLILYCYHYDPSTGSYAPAAMKIMRAGSLLTGVLLALLLSTFWLREWRRRRAA